MDIIIIIIIIINFLLKIKNFNIFWITPFKNIYLTSFKYNGFKETIETFT